MNQQLKAPHDQSAHTHYQHMLYDLQKRFIICSIITIPIIFLSFYKQLFTLQWAFIKKEYVLFMLGSCIFFYGGKPFLQGLVNEVKSKRPGMMTLVGLAITIAYIYSAVVVFGFPGELFFWELATLIDVMLFGHIIEMRSLQAASTTIQNLTYLLPAHAHLIKNNTVTDIPTSSLQKGDIVLIRPGEKNFC